MADKIVKAQLELDANGVKRGAKEAEDAIKKVEESIEDLGNTGSKAPNKVKDGLDDVGDSANKAKPKIEGLKSALDSVQKVGQTLTTTLTLPLVGFGALAVNTTKDFKYSMAEVSAISGATGDDLAKLEEQAKTLGATTFFSATEASQGMKYFAMAGYEVDEIMSALPATLNLAIASGENSGKDDLIANVSSSARKSSTSSLFLRFKR